MTDQLYGYRTLSVIDRINRASTPEAVLEPFEEALAEIGADCFCVTFLPRPGERIEGACMAWQVPAEWRALYSSNNYFQSDPAVRHSRRTVVPFDWASAPYDHETEPHMKRVVDRARDFNMDKGIAVPIPSPGGIIGAVWVAGPHFEDREVHEPVLLSLGLHVFHRVQLLVGGRLHGNGRITDREREILAWASEGNTAWEIGCILNISQRMVDLHIRRACKKLGATNRLQAIAILGDAAGTFDPIIEKTPGAR